MRHNVPVECAAELCDVTHKTAFEWRHRVLATVSGYQDRIVLRDTVWVDETYVNDSDLSKGHGQARKRGLSRQKLNICVAIDVHKNPVPVACGHGEPGSARIRKAIGGRIAPGPLLIHDLERAHAVLVGDGGFESEAHSADVYEPVYLERMEVVNDLCSWLKRYLWRFTWMSPRNLQAYLDLYVYLFRVNQARDRLDPTARVVCPILMADATYRSLR
ncbi:MAG TPA: IS1595 family transposase [Coriobacteriaceae bacterium]|nr:IS1595 family transposase [Coriobacteriaceae bacterium]